MPPMLEDEFEESSDAMDEEIEDGIAENAGQDGDSQQALEEEDAGADQASVVWLRCAGQDGFPLPRGLVRRCTARVPVGSCGRWGWSTGASRAWAG